MVLKVKNDYKYTNKSFMEEDIGLKDIYFMKEICKDDTDWELVYSKKDVYGCYSKADYFDKCSFFTDSFSVKFNLLIPFNWKRVLTSILPRYSDMAMSDGFVKSFDEIKHVEGDEKTSSYSIYNVINDLKFPFNHRNSSQVVSYHYDEKEKVVYFIFRPYLTKEEYDIMQDEKLKEKFILKDGKKHYIMMNFYVQKFEFFHEEATLFTSTHVVNFEGWTKNANFLGKHIVKLLSKQVKKRFVKCVENNIKEEVERLKKDPVGRLVLECIEKIDGTYKSKEEEHTQNEEIIVGDDDDTIKFKNLIVE